LTPQWFAIWTHSHSEQLVYDQLVAKGFDAYAPTVPTWSRRAGIRRLIPRPLFPSYLFVRRAMDKESYIEILKARGVVRVLGERWDRLTPIPDAEMMALQQVINSDLPVLPHPHLQEGQRVRIDAGPLAGIEGIFLRSRPQRGLLVLSVELLRQSISVEVDCTVVSPIADPLPPLVRSTSHAASSWL
jgi:transcription termination/antitermination protein NusG